MNPKDYPSGHPMGCLLPILILALLLACEPEPEVVDSLDRDKQRIDEIQEHQRQMDKEPPKDDYDVWDRGDYYDNQRQRTPADGGGPK